MAGSSFAKIFYRILGAKIGKNTFINTRGLHDAYLLEIGDNVVIGAGSVVNKDIPSNSVAVGNPCKVIKKI